MELNRWMSFNTESGKDWRRSNFRN